MPHANGDVVHVYRPESRSAFGLGQFTWGAGIRTTSGWKVPVPDMTPEMVRAAAGNRLYGLSWAQVLEMARKGQPSPAWSAAESADLALAGDLLVERAIRKLWSGIVSPTAPPAPPHTMWGPDGRRIAPALRAFWIAYTSYPWLAPKSPDPINAPGLWAQFWLNRGAIDDLRGRVVDQAGRGAGARMSDPAFWRDVVTGTLMERFAEVAANVDREIQASAKRKARHRLIKTIAAGALAAMTAFTVGTALAGALKVASGQISQSDQRAAAKGARKMADELSEDDPEFASELMRYARGLSPGAVSEAEDEQTRLVAEADAFRNANGPVFDQAGFDIGLWSQLTPQEKVEAVAAMRGRIPATPAAPPPSAVAAAKAGKSLVLLVEGEPVAEGTTPREISGAFLSSSSVGDRIEILHGRKVAVGTRSEKSEWRPVAMWIRTTASAIRVPEPQWGEVKLIPHDDLRAIILEVEDETRSRSAAQALRT